jgi:DNA-binding LytR/AlgR family response regulator
VSAPTAVVADDEPHLLDYLCDALATTWPELTIVARAGNGRDAVAAIERYHPETAFLDIHMPLLSGIEVAERLPAGVRVVFVTAYDRYAVDAFERAAIDYLLKPVTTERLARTVARLKEHLGHGAHPDPAVLRALLAHLRGAETRGQLRWLRVGRGDAVQLVDVDDVVFFRSDHKYTSAFTADAEHLVRTPLKEIEVQLDPERFWRIHRSTVVNVAAVAQARRDFRGRLQLTLKARPERLTVSRSFAHVFRQM